MPDPQPALYILHGENEVGIADFIKERKQALGDPSMAEMNTVQLDGLTHTLDQLDEATSALPFLTQYRLVVFSHPLERVRTEAQQKRLLEILDGCPPSALLVLAVDHFLTEARERQRGKLHWLERWALDHPQKAALIAFPLPVGTELAHWIQARAKVYGGQFTLQAANLLAQLVGPEMRALDQEIQKLLTFVANARPVEGDDVQLLTPMTADVGDFALVNALRNRNPQQALQVLRRQLEDEDPLLLLHRVVGQFRAVLQVREILEQGGAQEDVARILKMHPYRAQSTIEHARRFSMADLEKIYHRLFDAEVAIKTGEMEGALALEVLITELSM